MSDALGTTQRSYNMSRIRSKSTTPERAVGHALWHNGYRYRLNDKHLPGSPDLVLPKYRTAIFVHGCFWHRHKNCKYATRPKTNTEFWEAKITRNQQRDQAVWQQLEAKGWFVIIVWECELKKGVIDDTIKRIEAEIIHNGELYQKIQENRREARKEYLAEMKLKKEREASALKELSKF